MADDKDAELLKELKEAAKGVEIVKKAGDDAWEKSKGSEGK